jgi:beta-lactamase class A
MILMTRAPEVRSKLIISCTVAVLASAMAAYPAAIAAPIKAASKAPGATATATQAGLQSRLEALARRARPGQLGIAVYDSASGKSWGVDADVPFIMMSMFKSPVSAAVLSRVDAGQLTLDQVVTLTPADVVPGSAVPSVGDQLAAGKTTFTIHELLTGAVSQSDSTAVDAMLKLLGGPRVVTAYLRDHDIDGMQVDVGEREIGRVAENLQPGQALPAHESRAQTAAREKLGYAAALADPRNRSTPRAAVDYLRKLAAGELLSPQSTALLIDLMRKQTIPARLRGGVPADADFAGKTGTGTTVNGRTVAWNDIGIITLPGGRRIFVAAYLRDTAMPRAKRDTLFADIARAVTAPAAPDVASR